MKVLVLRLSSLGDVVLATSALKFLPASAQVDWVVASEFAPLLQSHPQIRKAWSFERKTRISAWIQLGKELWNSDYDCILDLHRSLRTRLLRILFLFWSLTSKNQTPRWGTVSKQRLRHFGFCLFKALWPARLRPSQKNILFAKVVQTFIRQNTENHHSRKNGSAEYKFSETSNVNGVAFDFGKKNTFVQPKDMVLLQEPYYCVMPSSRWPGKCWSVDRFFEVIRRLPVLPVILGSTSDIQSRELVERLTAAGVAHVSGVGRWNLPEVGAVLSGALFYFGNDTGLSHLSEAVGTPAFVLFGPTRPEMGFGPSLKESQAIETPLWCRPCGKDGRFCFRLFEHHACLKRLMPEDVIPFFEKFLVSKRPKEKSELKIEEQRP